MSVPYVTPWEIYAASIVLPLLGIVVVLLRFYARTLKRNSIGFDDWLMLPALVWGPYSGMGTSLLIGVHKNAIGYAITPNEQITQDFSARSLFLKIGYAYQILMVLQSGIIKLSITLYYRRIFVIGAGVFFDWINRAAIAIVVLWTAGFFFIAVFPCGAKFYAAWSDLGAYCQVSFDVTSSFIISDLITDVLVLCLPLPIIWTLQMSTKKRLIVTGIFATGAVSIVASIIKVVITYETMHEVSKHEVPTHIDLYLASSTTLYWAMMEGGLAVIAACLPTLRIVVDTASLSNILYRLRSALGWSSDHSQNEELQQISRRFPPRSGGSCAQIGAASSASLTFCLARETNENPISTSSTGPPNNFSEPESHGIQIEIEDHSISTAPAYHSFLPAS